MARAGILYSHVAHAAAQVAEGGKNPTVDSVREALGDTGSKSTIAPFLKRWKAEHQNVAASGELGIPVTLLQAIKGVYEQLQAEVEQRLVQTQHAHQGELQAALATAQQLKAQHGELTGTNARLSTALETTEATISRLEMQQHVMNITLATVQSENTGLQQRLSDRAAEISALNQQLTQARMQFEHYQEAAAVQRTEERQTAERQVVRMEQELEASRSRLAAQQGIISQQEEKLLHLAAENGRLQEVAHKTQDNLGRIRPERDQLAYQVKELTASREKLKDKLDAAHQDLAAVRAAVAGQEKEAHLLTEQVMRAELKADELTRANVILLQECAVLKAQVADQLRSSDNPPRST